MAETTGPSLEQLMQMSFRDAARAWDREIDEAFAEVLKCLYAGEMTGRDKKNLDTAKARLEYAMDRTLELKAVMYGVGRITREEG